jgi:hypothetical protein
MILCGDRRNADRRRSRYQAPWSAPPPYDTDLPEIRGFYIGVGLCFKKLFLKLKTQN